MRSFDCYKVMLKTFKLKNGIKVATYDLPNLKSLHLKLSCKGGSVAEDLKHKGVAHLMEHMLVQGIPSLPSAQDLSRFIEGLAGVYGAYTQQLLIGFDLTVPAPYLSDAVRIASEVFFEPLFSQEALTKERGVVGEEIRQRMDSKYYLINKFLNQSRFRKNHPLSFDVGGQPEVVEKLTRQDIINYWQRFFVPGNTWIVAVGNFSENNLKKCLEQYFGKYNPGDMFSVFPYMEPSDFSGRGVKIREDSTLQSDYVDLTFPALSMDADLALRMKQNLLLTVLSRLRQSRLFKLLRFEKGLVYNVSASASTMPGLGYVDIFSEASQGKLKEVVALTMHEVAAFVKNGPTKEEMEFAKNFLINRWLMAFDHPSSIAEWIEGDLLWEEEVKLPEEAVKMIQDVSLEELLALMQKYWDFSKLNLTLQGPLKNERTEAAKYEKILEELK